MSCTDATRDSTDRTGCAGSSTAAGPRASPRPRPRSCRLSKEVRRTGKWFLRAASSLARGAPATWRLGALVLVTIPNLDVGVHDGLGAGGDPNSLIRRSGPGVHTRPPLCTSWGQIPDASLSGGPCSRTWQQCWQHSRATHYESVPRSPQRKGSRSEVETSECWRRWSTAAEGRPGAPRGHDQLLVIRNQPRRL